MDNSKGNMQDWQLPLACALFLVVIALVCLCGVHSAQAEAGPKQISEIPWDVLDGGGGLMCSESYSVGGSLGQIAPGVCTTTTRIVSAGYWAGIDSLPPGQLFPCGDCNGDGKVTFADALALKNWYYQTPPGSPPCQGQGDVNLDGKITFGDALYIKNYYYQTPPGSPPPCEPPKDAPLKEKRMER